MRLSWLAECGNAYFAPIAASPPESDQPLIPLSKMRHLSKETRATLDQFSTQYPLQTRQIK
jgi:hypothetical protein